MGSTILKYVLIVLFLIFTNSNSSPLLLKKIPRLNIHNGIDPIPSYDSFASLELESYYYNQTLDHFNYQPQSYATFQQRYVISFKHWRGADAHAPIFINLGEESPMENDIAAAGFITDNAPQFGALSVFIEHRFYGKSIPFVSREKALQNATLRGYFNSAQALADYAEIILYIKKSLSADKSPVIVFGGSYGGMLATWFRLKYPHIALGALASSAPILYFDDITPSEEYYHVATKDFRETSESCYNIIKQSWDEIDRVAAKENGLSLLSKKFKTCKTLENVGELKGLLETVYAASAQYDKPGNYVNQTCQAITSAPQGTDLLDRVFLGLVSFAGNQTCYDPNTLFWSSETTEGWNWQVCSDLVIPLGVESNETMFPIEPFDVNEFSEACKSAYGVLPRPHWITSYFGGHDIKEVLKRFGSNIIFSNGLRDPYSSGGVLEDISDSIVALNTTQGSHCLDIGYANTDDPEWLVALRNKELEIISRWILNYYQDLFES